LIKKYIYFFYSQVLIKVAAAGVNPVDVYIVAGNFGVNDPLPWILGWDAAGVVEAVGSKVSRLKVWFYFIII
jgi:NADPH:quinone reductase-like Zn-dependent oxidoreductase